MCYSIAQAIQMGIPLDRRRCKSDTSESRWKRNVVTREMKAFRMHFESGDSIPNTLKPVFLVQSKTVSESKIYLSTALENKNYFSLQEIIEIGTAVQVLVNDKISAQHIETTYFDEKKINESKKRKIEHKLTTQITDDKRQQLQKELLTVITKNQNLLIGNNEAVNLLIRQRRDLIKEVLQTYRSFGGDKLSEFANDPEHKKWLKQAQQFYPTSWLTEIANMNPVFEWEPTKQEARTMTALNSENPYKSPLVRVPSEAPIEALRTFIHEPVHLLELSSTIGPKLSTYEKEFVEARCTIADGGLSELKTFVSEESSVKYRLDKFSHDGFGIEFGNMYEIFARTMTAIWTNDFGGLLGVQEYVSDIETEAFGLGLLLSL